MQFSNTVGKINNFRTDISDKGFEPDMSNEHDTSRLF